MSFLWYNDDYGFLSHPRYFELDSEEYNKLTSNVNDDELIGKQYLVDALVPRDVPADVSETYSSLALKAKILIENNIPEHKDYIPCRILLANQYYMYSDGQTACADSTQHELGYVDAGVVNGLQLFYITDPVSGKYFYRTDNPHGENNPDWYLYEIGLGNLDESSDKFKWYVSKNQNQENQPRIINYFESSENATSVGNNDYGLHIKNWNEQWMGYPSPKIACGKGLYQGDDALKSKIEWI